MPFFLDSFARHGVSRVSGLDLRNYFIINIMSLNQNHALSVITSTLYAILYSTVPWLRYIVIYKLETQTASTAETGLGTGMAHGHAMEGTRRSAGTTRREPPLEQPRAESELANSSGSQLGVHTGSYYMSCTVGSTVQAHPRRALMPLTLRPACLHLAQAVAAAFWRPRHLDPAR